MKHIIYAKHTMEYHILKQMKDGTYEDFAECDNRAAADILVQALNALDAEMNSQKEKKNARA